ncbi:hypothetical protein PCYB_147300 [Plasmodium cynomolgi strain B]|uniref:Uncharacterized protein n=1 Tax=Plasmodium cynomolgi (strain B) TaxID=1120755 RepID=K6VIT5_PLACD|nr:hypothetical protein PCYB_147300 [Plasmodium cynomolgi strain B]GAB69302.1 hypothetical protein PCYB_147300 [Plasmodium cynomolgi strain B]
MNSRTPCVILYAVSLVVCVVVIFSLNKYERQGVPLHKLSSTSALVKEIYNAKGWEKPKGWEKAKGREEPKGERPNWSNERLSQLSIKLFIVSTSEEGRSDSLGTKMKEYFSSQIEFECKDKPAAQSISDVQELFYVDPLLVSGDEMRSDDNREFANVCLSSSPENGTIHNMLNNRYIICLSENREEKDTNVAFTLKRSNTIHVKFSQQGDNPTTYYQRSIFFSPELDLNFYLASSLYNEGNYKVGKYNTAGRGRNKNGGESKGPQGGESKGPQGGESKDPQGGESKGPQGGESKDPQGDDPNGYASYVNIATWDFYDQVYYPYLRNFTEQLMNVFQINIYTQIIGNIDLFKISEKTKEVGDKRVIILDKVTKLTSIFDDVTFGDIIRRPTYHIPKSINLMAVFPSGEEIFFYNPATGKLETTVSFAEWGVLHINGALQRGEEQQQQKEAEKKTGERKKKKYVSVSEEAPLISGHFISHLRQYLGLGPKFSDYIYTIFDAEKYDIKYVRSESTDEGNSFLYSVRSEDKLQLYFLYEIPVRHGIFPFELLALMREAYVYYVVESLSNLGKFVSISNVSIYFRVPMHAVHVFNDILDKVKCSLELMRGADGCKNSHLGKFVRETFQSYGGGTSGDTHEGDNRRGEAARVEEAARLRETYFRAAIVLAQSAYQDSLQLLSDDTFSIYDILSKDFLLASVLPVLIPYAIPVTFSLFRELFRSIKLAKEKQKVD